LLLRGIVCRENPHHAAILNSFPETRQEQSRNHENTMVGGSGTGGRVKSEPGIKRERNAAAFTDVINLLLLLVKSERTLFAI
jgi:hypothetical protein